MSEHADGSDRRANWEEEHHALDRQLMAMHDTIACAFDAIEPPVDEDALEALRQRCLASFEPDPGLR